MNIYAYEDSDDLQREYLRFVLVGAFFTWLSYSVIHEMLSPHGSAALYPIRGEPSPTIPLYGWFELSLMPIFSVGGLILSFLGARPIGVSKEGVSRYIFSRR